MCSILCTGALALISSQGSLPKKNLKVDMNTHLDLAKQWATLHGYKLEAQELVISDGACPSLNAKGHDVKILLLWAAPEKQAAVLFCK